MKCVRLALCLLCVVSVVLAGSAQAQISFFQTPTYSGTATGNLFVADFNSDGRPDILVSDGTMNLGNGDGSFTPGTSVSGRALAVADFNGDGRPDVLQLGTGTLLVLLGNGDGTFQPAITTASGAGLTGVIAVDLNGDGKADIVGTYGTFIFVYISNGDGTFKAGVPYNMGTSVDYSLLALGDFNGDGKTDVVISLYGIYPSGGQEIVLLGNGDGTFQAPKVSPNPPDVWSVAAGDFNGEGKLDLAVGTFGGCLSTCGAGGTYILLGNGDGTFQSATTTAFPGSGPLLAADLNGDGKLDLVLQSDPQDVQIFLGNGDGTFSNTANYIVSFPITTTLRAQLAGPATIVNGGIALADFNGSGKEDLALGNAILLGNGDGTFKGIRVASTSPVFAIGDFDKNGTLDIAATDLNNVYILSNDGTGMLTKIQTYPLSFTNGPTDIVTADFNGDGNLDLLVTNSAGTTWGYSVFLGNGDGSFQAPLSYAASCSPGSLTSSPMAVVADFNHDHKLDFAVPLCTNSLSVLMGNGDGTFAAPVSYYDGSGANALVAGDFNEDGKIDIAAAAQYSPSASTAILFGNGDGTFQAAVFPQSLQNFAAEFSADLNNDGKPDLISTNQVALGNGDGTFFLLSKLPYSVIGIGDVNGDGRADLLFTTGSQSGVALGHGDGTFGPAFNVPAFGTFPATYVQGPGPWVIADMNGDKKPDIVFPWPGFSYGRNPSVVTGVSVLLNTTSSEFELLASALSPSAVTAGNSSTSTVTVMSNFGFNGAVALSCSGLPSGASCSFNPASIANASGTSALTIATTASTAAGSYSVQIQGSENGAMNNSVVSLVVQTAPDFTMGAASGSPTSQTISAGETASFSLAFAGTGSFTGTVNLSCAITPAATPAPTCSVPSTVQISGSGTQTATVKVGTTAPVTSAAVPPVNVTLGPMLLAWTLMFLGSTLLWMRNRKRLPVLAAPLVVLALAFAVGCGGSGSSSSTTHTTPGTPAGTYTATVTATSGSTSHNMALQVIVQ